MKSVKTGLKAYNRVFQTNIFRVRIILSYLKPLCPWWRLHDTCYICAVVWPNVNAGMAY